MRYEIEKGLALQLLFESEEQLRSTLEDPDKYSKHGLLMWGVGGSYLYNLQTKYSDVDVVLVADTLALETEMHYKVTISGVGYDVWLMTAGALMKGVLHSSPNYVDVYSNDHARWIMPSPLFPVVSSLRFNSHAYVDGLLRHTKSDIMKYCAGGAVDARQIKSLKTATRNMFMVDLMRHYGTKFSPQTMHHQRNKFFYVFAVAVTLDRDYDVIMTWLEEEATNIWRYNEEDS